MNAPIPKMNCLKEITVLFAEKAGRRGSSWTSPFRHLPDKLPKLLQNGSAGGKNYANELKKSWFKFLPPLRLLLPLPLPPLFFLGEISNEVFLHEI